MHMTPISPLAPWTPRRVLAAVVVLAAGAVAGCAPTVPDSAQGQGVGFQDYGSYLRNHSAPGAATADAGSYAAPASPYAATQPYGTASAGGFSTDAAAAAIDRAAGATTSSPYAATPAYGAQTTQQTYAAAPAAPAYDATSANRARGNAPAGIAETTSEMNYAGNHAGISDEQDFKAVSSRETIESDKERIARNRAQYQVVEPTAVPNRPAAATDVPNIAQYALSTTNLPGQPLYRRGGLHLSDPLAICARFGSNDRAQEAFLAAGGPNRDPKGLDPDGDGFACDWDPRPFRAALQ